jgi:hypothetical protein
VRSCQSRNGQLLVLLMLLSVEVLLVIGPSQYITLARPNIAFSMNKVCQLLHKPTIDHWVYVKKILNKSVIISGCECML